MGQTERIAPAPYPGHAESPVPSDLIDLADPTVPDSWVVTQWSPSFWFVRADVRDFVGPERWAALDTAWMAEKSGADLARFGPRNQNPSEHMFSGLWRLGLLREEVIAAIAQIDGEADWPLDSPGSRLRVAWRPRVERWRRFHPEDDLTAKLMASWRDALAAGQVGIGARIVEALDTWVDRTASDPLAPGAQEMVRRAIATIERGHLPRGILFLIERFGVPEGVDLEPVLAAVRERYFELEDEVVPLPNPYDLHLQCLRLEGILRPR